MSIIQKTLQYSATPFFPIHLISFLFTFHVALVLYINSSFLGQFLSSNAIGLVFTAASILTLFLLAQFPFALSCFGNYKTIVWILLAQMALLLILAFASNPIIIIPIFILTQIFITLISFNLDVFLEQISSDKTTGQVRGAFLTIVNTAILLGALTTGVILTNGDFWKIYLIAAIFLIPTLFIVTQKLGNFKDRVYKKTPYLNNLRDIFFAHHPNDEIRHIIFVNILLNFFYSWMIIYTPIYLSEHIGFTWSEIGVMFAIMLLPFIIFELPVGKLADTRIGEKKIMLAGFFIMSLFTASLFFVREPSLFIWAALLFGTRIGASFIEITSESYFFKHIDSADTKILSIFRDSRPVAYIIAPLAASLFLFIFDMRYLFLILAGILLSGVWITFNMRSADMLFQKTIIQQK